MGISLPIYDYDCVKCGACCASNWQDQHYVYLSNEDLGHLSDDRIDQLVGYFDEENQHLPAIKTKRNEQGYLVCAALDGRVGCSVSCSIYENRPSICRKFQPGSAECSYARKEILGISNK